MCEERGFLLTTEGKADPTDDRDGRQAEFLCW